MNDLKFAFRQLLKNPVFTTVAVLTLALGIGSTTGIFSVVNAVLLRPLPYPEPERLVELTDRGGPIAIPNFADWKEQQTVFEHLFLYKVVDFNLIVGQESATRVVGVRLSADAFEALRVNPAVGRFFAPEEDKPGAAPVSVLSHRLWRNRFAGSPEVVGRKISINGADHIITGVTPPTFELVENAEVFIPVEPGINEGDRNSRKNQSSYEAAARLKPGVTFEQARAGMETIAQRLAQLHPDTNKDRPIGIRSLTDAKVGGVRRPLWILLGAVLLVLLVACANVANLLMVRATGRRKEMAVRSALGADQGRILRQMLTESVMLAAVGGVLGVLLARWGMALIGGLAQGNLPRAAEIGLDGRVLLFSMGVALFTGILFGFAPAWQSSRPNLSTALNDASRGSSGGPTPFLHSLMVGQVALSLMLLVGAGLLLRSFHRLSNVNAGFNHERVLTFRLDLPEQKYATQVGIDRFAQEMLERLRALPGVTAASLATAIPTGDRDWTTDILVEGRPEPKSHPLMEVDLVGSDYFKVLGIPILKGRAFNESDSRQPARGDGRGAIRHCRIEDHHHRRGVRAQVFPG